MIRKTLWNDVYNAMDAYSKHLNMRLTHMMVSDYGIILYFSRDGRRDMNAQNLCTIPYILNPGRKRGPSNSRLN